MNSKNVQKIEQKRNISIFMDDKDKNESVEQEQENGKEHKEKQAPSPKREFILPEQNELDKFFRRLDLACQSDSEYSKDFKEFVSEFATGPTFPETLLKQIKNFQPDGTGKSPVFKLGLEGEEIGHFFIEEKLGAGGMGVVYKARDVRLGRLVAIKVLNSKYNKNETMRQLLLREAQSAAKLSHPNITAIHDMGRFENRDFIVMEFVEGKSLREVIAKNGIPWKEAIKIAQQIAAGLAEAHQGGIIHRDLKPENVIVKANGQVKILDFGLAKHEQATETACHEPSDRYSPDPNVTAGQAGTPRYMSPEQLKGEPASKRSDVYAFGVTFKEMLLGSNNATSDDSILKTYLFPKEIKTIIQRCTNHNPSERFPSSLELYEALAFPLLDEKHTQKHLLLHSKLSYYLFGVFLIFIAFIFLLFYFRNSPGISFKANSHKSTPKLGKAHLSDSSNHMLKFIKNTDSLTRLTSNSIEARIDKAVISPDGKFLAFTDNEGLFIQNLSDLSISPLQTVPKLVDRCLSWYPDGKHLLVSASSAKNIKRDLWKVNISTGIASGFNIYQDKSIPLMDYFCGTVSPNGHYVSLPLFKKLLLIDLTKKHRAKTLFSVNNNESISTNTAWSPDSKRIAVARTHSNPANMLAQIDAIDIKSSKVITLINTPRLNQEVRQIAFSWTLNNYLIYALAPWQPHVNDSGIWALKLDPFDSRPTENPVKLANLPNHTISSISIDRNNKKIIFLKHDTQKDVYIGDLNNHTHSIKNFRRLSLLDSNEVPSSWSLDNQFVLLNSDMREGHSIYRQNISGGPLFKLFKGSDWSTWPTEAPDGKHILFWLLPNDKHKERAPITLMMLNKETNRNFPLLKIPEPTLIHGNGFPPPHDWKVNCALKGNRCIVSKENQNHLLLYELDIDNKKIIPLGKIHRGSSSRLKWALSSDGKYIATTDIYDASILVYSIRGGTPLKKFQDEKHCWPHFVTWAPNDNGVIVTSACNGEDKVGQVRYLGPNGIHRTLWASDQAWLTNPIVSIDGKKIAISLMWLKTNAWLLKTKQLLNK